MIVKGAVTTGGTWIDVGSNSSVEYNLTATSMTSVPQLEIGYIINSNQSSVSPSLANLPFKYQLERNSFTANATEFIICLECSGANQTAWASFNWEEST